MDVSIPKFQHKTVCRTEYDTLQKVILCKPEHMTIKDVINETQKHFEDDNIHVKTANDQHSRLVEALRSHNVEVVLLPVRDGLPEQVFTRDIGFVIGEKAFLSSMTEPIRQGEEAVIKDFFTAKVSLTPACLIRVLKAETSLSMMTLSMSESASAPTFQLSASWKRHFLNIRSFQ